MNIKDYFSHISFNAEKHRYRNQHGEEYRSASSIIARYTPYFDAEKVAKEVAERDGTPKETLKAQWRIKRDYSCVKGTDLHLYIESYLSQGIELEPVVPIQHEINQFHKFWNNNKDKFEVSALELIVAEDDFRIAGTIDCLLKHSESGKIYIADWKSNKEIAHSNDFEKFKPPLNHLDHCQFNKYSLQLSLYRRILELSIGMDIAGCLLIHFLADTEYRVIQCKDFRNEINQILYGS